MKKIVLKSSALVVAILLSVLFIAPAMLHADTASVEITPEYGEIPALGQTAQYTAWAVDGAGDKVDVTATATWTIANSTIASNDGGGAFTATAEGSTYVFATSDGVTGGASLNVWKPMMFVTPGKPDELTHFNLQAWGCGGLSWALDVTGPTEYSNSGTIPLTDNWYSSLDATLSEGNYEAVFSVGGTVQDTRNFTVWEHAAWMDVNPGYAGEETKITLNAENSDGATAFIYLQKKIGEDEWEEIDSSETVVAGDPWSITYAYILEKGTYWTGFALNDNWEDTKEFSVVNRGTPKPPVKKADPATGSTSGPAINEKPITSYDKTSSGFVNLFYNRILSRASEKAGLDAWLGRLTSGGLTGADLVSQFIFGQECQKTISGYTNTAFVTFLYKTLFNREPDKDGLNAWLARINGGMTKEEVVNGFTHSLEFELICKNFGIKPYPNYTETGK